MNFNDYLILIGIIVVWFILIKIIFPKLGLPT